MLEITDQNYKDTVSAAPIAAIVFTAEWCGACRLIKPRLPKVTEAYPEVVLGTIDAEKNRELVVKFGVKNLPLMVMMTNGVEVDRMFGNINVAEAIKKLGGIITGESDTLDTTEDF